MEKRKCLTFLFCLVLYYSLFQHFAIAQSSSQISIDSQGSITYSPLNVNLAVIPDDWYLAYGTGPQIIYLDYSVTRNGRPSIRLEPHVDGVDVNYAREVNGRWYAVKPGDHIVAKCWMRIDANPNETSPYDGARIGIDLYCDEGILDGYPHSGQEHLNAMVVWGTTVWTQKTWDFVIPDTYYTSLDDGTPIAPTQVSEIVMWMQVLPPTALGNAWFADAELYIIPT